MWRDGRHVPIYENGKEVTRVTLVCAADVVLLVYMARICVRAIDREYGVRDRAVLESVVRRGRPGVSGSGWNAQIQLIRQAVVRCVIDPDLPLERVSLVSSFYRVRMGERRGRLEDRSEQRMGEGGPA